MYVVEVVQKRFFRHEMREKIVSSNAKRKCAKDKREVI